MAETESSLQFHWTTDRTEITAAVDFFIAQTGPEYISHGEVQSGRATDKDHWSPRLKSVLLDEFGQCIVCREEGVTYRLGLAISGNQLAGIMYVEFRLAGDASYAVLQDMVISRELRGRRIGGSMLSWLENEIKDSPYRWLFLESGIKNEPAHAFFEKKGFEPCSKIFVKDLGGE